MDRRSVSYLALAAVFASGAIAVVALGITSVVIRTVLALPLALFWPGYVITVAIFPKQNLAGIEKLLFSIVISVAITVIGGMILNLTPWGLREDSWVVLLGGFTIVFSLLALLSRRENLPTDLKGIWTSLNPPEIALIGLSVLVVVGAIVVARIGVFQQPIVSHSELWMIPADKTDPDSLRVGVRNTETSAQQYKLHIQVSDQIIREWPLIEIQPGETWETTLHVPADALGTNPVKALLFLLNDPQTVYRRVAVWRNTETTR